MIDWTRVAQLRDEIGPEDFDEVAGLFLTEVEETLMQLTGAESDAAQMQGLFHFLKGSTLNLGFEDMSKVCAKGEVDAAKGVVSVTANELRSLYAASKKAFETGFAQRFAA